MPLPTLQDQYIFPAIGINPRSGKVVEIRLNPKGDDRYDVRGNNRVGAHPTDGTSFLITSRQMVGKESSLVREDELSDADGAQLSPEMAFVFLDQFFIKGDLTDAAGSTTTDVTQDFGASGITFSDFLFSHADTADYIPCWITIIRNDGSRQIIFNGDISTGKSDLEPGTVSYKDLPIFNPHTSTERKQRIVTVKIRSWTQRAKATSIEAVRIAIFGNGASDMTAQAPFWGGLISQPDYTGASVLNVFANPSPGVNVRDWIASLVKGGTWDQYFDVAAYGHYGQPTNMFGSPDIDDSSGTTYTFPDSTWGMKLVRVITRLCDALNYDHTEATDVISAFEFTRGEFHDTPTSGAGAGYSDDVVAVADLEICYNYLFAVNPQPSHPPGDFTAPNSWAEDTMIMSALSQLCWQLGCRVKIDIDQTTGYCHLKLVPRFATTGSLPSSWVLAPDSSEGVQQTSKRVLEIKCANDNTTLRIPKVRASGPLQIEVPFRAKTWGDSNSGSPWGLNNLVYDYGKKPTEQWVFWDRSDATKDSGMSDDGYVPSNYLYYFEPRPVTVNKYYPGNITPDPLLSWDGFYMIRSVTEKSGIYMNRGNSLFGPGQYYAKGMLGSRKVITRNYLGVCDDTGDFNALDLNMTSNWRHAGQLRDFDVVKMKRDVITGKTQLEWKERIDFGSDDLTFKYVSRSANTTSGGGGSSTSGGAIIDYNGTVISSGKFGADVDSSLNAEYRYQGITFIGHDGTIVYNPRLTAVQGTGPGAKDWAVIPSRVRCVIISWYDALVAVARAATLGGSYLFPMTLDEYHTPAASLHVGQTVPTFQFAPTLAGYWEITAGIKVTGAAPGYVAAIQDLALFKNGSALPGFVKTLWRELIGAAAPVNFVASGSRMFDFNGATDFVELGWTDGNAPGLIWPSVDVFFEAHWRGPLGTSAE